MEWIRSAAFALAGLIIGFLVGHFSHQLFSLHLKDEVGVGDVFNFTLTLVFAFLLQNYLQKRFGDKRAEKDHLIDLIKESVAITNDTRSAFADSYQRKKILAEDRRLILNYTRNLSNSIDLIKTCLTSCGLNEEATECDEIASKYLEVKRLLTGGSFPSKPYTSDTFTDAEGAFAKVTNALHQLRIDINRK